jgi:hypothetical protein
MQQNNNIFLDLEFKIPSEKDKLPPLEYRPLSPRQYLDFIEMGIKFLPDFRSACERHMKNAPKVRFTL